MVEMTTRTSSRLGPSSSMAPSPLSAPFRVRRFCFVKCAKANDHRQGLPTSTTPLVWTGSPETMRGVLAAERERLEALAFHTRQQLEDVARREATLAFMLSGANDEESQEARDRRAMREKGKGRMGGA